MKPLDAYFLWTDGEWLRANLRGKKEISPMLKTRSQAIIFKVEYQSQTERLPLSHNPENIKTEFLPTETGVCAKQTLEHLYVSRYPSLSLEELIAFETELNQNWPELTLLLSHHNPTLRHFGEFIGKWPH